MSIRTPASMEYTPKIETYKLYGKSILKYTKEELAAFIIRLMERHMKDTEEHSRQMQNLISLRKSRRGKHALFKN